MDRTKIVGGGIILLLVSLVAGFVYFSVSGTFFEGIECDFNTVRNPDTNETYTGTLEQAKEDYKNDLVPYLVNEYDDRDISEQEANETFQKFDFRMRDGDLQVRNPELSCGSGGGSSK